MLLRAWPSHFARPPCACTHANERVAGVPRCCGRLSQTLGDPVSRHANMHHACLLVPTCAGHKQQSALLHSYKCTLYSRYTRTHAFADGLTTNESDDYGYWVDCRPDSVNHIDNHLGISPVAEADRVEQLNSIIVS